MFTLTFDLGLFTQSVVNRCTFVLRRTNRDPLMCHLLHIGEGYIYTHTHTYIVWISRHDASLAGGRGCILECSAPRQRGQLPPRPPQRCLLCAGRRRALAPLFRQHAAGFCAFPPLCCMFDAGYICHYLLMSQLLVAEGIRRVWGCFVCM